MGVALDGLLASVVWHRRKAQIAATGGRLAYCHDVDPEPLELPLARCGDDADWHWMATFADLHPRPDGELIDPDIRWRTSRTDRHRLQQLAPVIGSQVVSDSAGRYQRRIVPVMAHPATSLTWRAVGDPESIRDLLTDLGSIGKHRGVGEGLVSRWEVTEAPGIDLWSAGHEHAPGWWVAPCRCAACPPGRTRPARSRWRRYGLPTFTRPAELAATPPTAELFAGSWRAAARAIPGAEAL